MIITPSTLSMLRTTVVTKFKEAFETAKPWSKECTTEISSSNDSNTYAWIADFGKIREWVGPRQLQAMREHVQVVRNKPYEGTVEIGRDAIVDDAFGFYVDVITPGLGSAAAKHPDGLLVEDVFDANPVTYDGVNLWHGAHPTFRVAGETYSNSFALDFTSGIITDGSDTLAIVGDEELMLGEALAWVRAKMAAIPGESGRLLDVNLDQVIASRQREYMLRRVLHSSLTPTTSGSSLDYNPIRGLFRSEIYAGEIADPDVIILADTTKAIRPFVHQVRSRPVIKSLTDPNGENAVMNNVFVFAIDGDDGGSYRCAMTTSLPFLTAKLSLSRS